MILVDLERVSASRPGRPLFVDLSITISTGDRIGVVGLNGTGKSTLLRVLATLGQPESGTVRKGREVRIGFLDQRPELPPGSVLDAVGDGWEAEAVLEHLGMGKLVRADVSTLSGGQAKRVALARLLVHPSDLLILDEPTNHLDIEAIAWLEDRLARHRGGLVLVTHDRHVLDRVTTRVLELDRGKGYVHEGGYASYLEARALREEQAAVGEAVRRNLATRELAWLRRGAPARTRKPKARIESATAIVQGRAQAAARTGELDLHFGTPRLGDKVLELEGVAHRWPGGPQLFADLDLALDPRERLGIVGPNGSGKSTLLDIIAGRLVPTTGTVEPGTTVKVGYYDQTGADLDPNQRVREAVSHPHLPTSEDAVLLERFWFDRDAQFAPIATLSGGERRRLQLLLVLAKKPNVLLLDEPTNDLDLDTLRVLEDFFEEWPGALVTISHDRAFLERTVVDALVLDGGGGVARAPGGYAAWEAARRLSHESGGGSSGAPPAKPRTAPDTDAPAGDVDLKGRSSGTVQRLLRTAEREVAALDRRCQALTDELVAAGSDHVEMTRLGTALAALQQELAAAEERWIELAEEAEA